MAKFQAYGYKHQGGSLAADDPTYVSRPADKELLDRLQSGDLCYVFNARQMGKSSLRVRTTDQLQKTGHRCAVIDLAGIGSQATAEQWYRGFLFRLFRSFPELHDAPWKEWWLEHSFLPITQRFGEAIETILLKTVNDKIVVFIDEIDCVLNLSFSTDDFFGFIRNCYDRRATNPSYRKLTFCLIGVTTPSYLIQRKGLHPFNVGRAIELRGFTLENAKASLLRGLSEHIDNPASTLAEILAWTGGQPFLTQKLCQLVIRHSEGHSPTVEDIVREYVIEDWETKDEPEHLRTIRDRLLSQPNRKNRILGRYWEILKQGTVEATNTIEDIELQLAGIVTKEKNKLKVTNNIYLRIFNEAWIEHQLRPAVSLSQTWDTVSLASGGQTSVAYRNQVIGFNLALVGICAGSLGLAYGVVNSPAWAYAYGPYAGWIELIRAAILIGFRGYLLGFVWRSKGQALILGKTRKVKYFRRVGLGLFSAVLIFSLYHNLYAGPRALLMSQEQIAGDLAAVISGNFFQEYFLPSFFYTFYSTTLHVLIAVPFCLVSVFAVTEDYSLSIRLTNQLADQMKVIKQQDFLVLTKIVNLLDVVTENFNQYCVRFISLVSPYMTIFLAIEVIRIFEAKAGFKTLTDPGKTWIVVTYGYSFLAAFILVWTFSHYQRALAVSYKLLAQYNYDYKDFIAKNNLFRLLGNLLSVNVNLLLLIITIALGLLGLT